MKTIFGRFAFTMIELVFVIIVIGILSALAIPRFDRNNLREAADQVVSHIRYTQHLAMQENKFNLNDSLWYKKRWQIRFVKNLSYTNATCGVKTYNDIWAYMIYTNESCTTPGCNTNPNKSETAHNPLNSNELLSGGYNNDLCIDNSLNPNDMQSSVKMRLGESYGVKSIIFSGGCRSNITYIHFDNLGRPMNSFPTNSPYEVASPGWHKLIDTPCHIDLCLTNPCPVGVDIDKKVTIEIVPETGYTHTL